MNNIYTKQMQKLGLNPKQYAELIDIPYEVVKDFIYDKEGDYKMGLKELLRKNMLQKHQEVEENYEDAKFKAMEIKHNNKEINYLEWYGKEYSVSLLKSTLKINSISDFKKHYDLMFNGNRFSNWTYQVLLGKREYGGHEIATQKKEEFLKQLYDIIVNGNGNNYLRIKPLSSRDVSSTHNGEKAKILKWYKKFNFRKYLEDNNITQSDLSRLTGISTAGISKMINNGGTNYVTNNLITLYNYVANNSTKKLKSKEPVVEYINDAETVEDDNDVDLFKDLKEEIEENDEEIKEETQVLANDSTTNNEETENKEIKTTSETNSEILRRILINRLTEEERELIKIFGGVID